MKTGDADAEPHRYDGGSHHTTAPGMASSAWITDRAPCELDADINGCISIPSPRSTSKAISIPLENHRECQPWRHTHQPRAWRQKVRQEKAQAPDLFADCERAPRRFVSISRTDWTADESDGHTLDAIADDGTAWWKHSYQSSWTQHPPLPDRPL